MMEALEDVTHCQSYTSPKCFCSLKPFQALLQSSDVFGCLDSACYVSREPGKRFISSTAFLSVKTQ